MIASGYSKLGQFAIGMTVLIGFIAYAIGLTFAATPKVDSTVIGIILGGLGSMSTAVVSFYFGSSSSTEKKDDALAATAMNKDQTLDRIINHHPDVLVATKIAEVAAQAVKDKETS